MSEGVRPCRPPLPRAGWGHQKEVKDANNRGPSLRAPLDKFASEKAGLGRDDIIMTYLKNLPFGTPLSQKLQAEVVYLYFCGEDCPLLYDADGEEWYVWDLR